jgi:endonuclease/exonuclease/phosphatase family metal-dependent hydrolase
MSFNIRYGTADDGPNHWNLRRDLVVETIRRFDPDLFGTQETLGFQAAYLRDELRDYAYFGRSRQEEAEEGEQCGIFYRQSRFTWLAGGYFWLSETPETPASLSWDSSLPRMATWVLLHDRQSPQRPLLMVNTHFDHRGPQARLESARVIRRRINRLREIADDPQVVVTGDFNCAESSPPYAAFLDDQSQLFDSYRQLHPAPNDEEATFNSWRGNTRGGRIDWILASPSLRVSEVGIDRWASEGRYPSDHYPVTAVFTR